MNRGVVADDALEELDRPLEDRVRALAAAVAEGEVEGPPVAEPADASAGSGSADVLGSMSPVAALAYVQAEDWAADRYPACELDASFVGAIAEVETNHGTRGGGKLQVDGDTSRPIRGADGQAGPMLLTRSLWDAHATDGNGDGRASADNVYDAAVTTAASACELAREVPGTGGTLTDAGARHRVAFALHEGLATPYTVDPTDGVEGDEFADQVLDAERRIGPRLDAFSAVAAQAKGRIGEVVEWMREQVQLGARYAATNPGRFGTRWDGVPKRSFLSGRIYQYPEGTITYDCSGLMVTGFRRIGVDLEALGATWTGSMLTNLPRVERDDVQVGDLIIFGRGGYTTHVVMSLGGDRYIHSGGCGGWMGVCEREGIDWGRVVGVVRVPLGGGD